MPYVGDPQRTATVHVGNQFVVFRTSRGTYIRTESGEILDASNSHFGKFHSLNFHRKSLKIHYF